jgi:hypothetical protein
VVGRSGVVAGQVCGSIETLMGVWAMMPKAASITPQQSLTA